MTESSSNSASRRTFLTTAVVASGPLILVAAPKNANATPVIDVERAEQAEMQQLAAQAPTVAPSAEAAAPEAPKAPPISYACTAQEEPLVALPENAKLVDVMKHRMSPVILRHLLLTASRAKQLGRSEVEVMACLVHDLGLALLRPDHGHWGSQLIEPYVSKKVAWAVKYHQSLRFFPDEAVGYEYPKLYIKLFGADYRVPDWVEAEYKYARRHRWYMAARSITLADNYSWDSTEKVELDDFVDIIGRHFKQPKQGLGYDGSPVAHMWRTLLAPSRPL